jgi:MFS family permease
MGLLDKTRQFLALDKSLRTLLVTSVIMNLGSSLWGPLLGLYITNNLGVSLLMFGLMTTVRQLAQSLTIFPSGFLSDNFGRKKNIDCILPFLDFSFDNPVCC